MRYLYPEGFEFDVTLLSGDTFTGIMVGTVPPTPGLEDRLLTFLVTGTSQMSPGNAECGDRYSVVDWTVTKMVPVGA
jgi:hypothetical protein